MSEFKNYKICAPHTYTDRAGVEHKSWKEVGIIRWSEDKKFIQLNLVPGQTYMAFPLEKKPEAEKEVPIEDVNLDQGYPG